MVESRARDTVPLKLWKQPLETSVVDSRARDTVPLKLWKQPLETSVVESRFSQHHERLLHTKCIS